MHKQNSGWGKGWLRMHVILFTRETVLERDIPVLPLISFDFTAPPFPSFLQAVLPYKTLSYLQNLTPLLQAYAGFVRRTSIYKQASNNKILEGVKIICRDLIEAFRGNRTRGGG